MASGVVDRNGPKTAQYLTLIGEIVVLLNFIEAMVQFWTWELIAAAGDAHERQQIGRRITVHLKWRKLNC